VLISPAAVGLFQIARSATIHIITNPPSPTNRLLLPLLQKPLLPLPLKPLLSLLLALLLPTSPFALLWLHLFRFESVGFIESAIGDTDRHSTHSTHNWYKGIGYMVVLAIDWELEAHTCDAHIHVV
jgi:hypothetical protein